MPTLGEVCATYGAAYLDRYGDRVPSEQHRVLQRIADCGTGRLGSVSYRCAECNAVHHTHASCGDRHCPGCQTANNGQWCVEQTQKLLPCEYFLITFTIPAQLRRLVRSNQAVCYRTLFDAAASALRTVLADERFCGAEVVGFTAVLHTFGRDLGYHPHVHVIVPGGGMRDGRWRSTQPGFFAPVKVLSRLFRMEFERQLRKRLPTDRLPPAGDFRREFVCDAQAVGNGVATLKYLSRYVFRTAISNDRILAMHGGQVTFRYRRNGQHRDRRMTLDVFEFLRRFLQHVLPRGLHRVRHYGFLSRRSGIDLDEIRAVILESLREIEPDLKLAGSIVPQLSPRPTDDGPTCPDCGGRLLFERCQRIRPPPLTQRTGNPMILYHSP